MDAVPSNGDGRRMSSARVLVVEDHEPFRRFVCSMLEKRAELQVIGEASDGLEAVRKAEELQPDLILWRCRAASVEWNRSGSTNPQAGSRIQILFVSQETSTDLVQEALSFRALGYVAKTKAGIELLAAVEAVSQGRRFVGAGLARSHSRRTCQRPSFLGSPPR